MRECEVTPRRRCRFCQKVQDIAEVNDFCFLQWRVRAIRRVPTRARNPFCRQQSRELLAALSDAPCRIDLQLETPNGAVALREWAGDSRRVLLKCAEAARLVDNPWLPLERAA